LTSYHGPFVWCTLETTDMALARRFYADVVGWSMQPHPRADREYTLLQMAGVAVGGITDLSPEARGFGVTPRWRGYIAVDDVDAYVVRVATAGGRLQEPAYDIPGVGRVAGVADPGGAAFVLMRPQPSPDSPAEPALLPVTALGQVGWRELRNHPDASAFAFYTQVFGWFRLDSLEVGELGSYHLLSNGEQLVGGVITPQPPQSSPCWLYYFNVPTLDAALARVRAGGGSIVYPPIEVPSGQWAAHCCDPQGALFALLAPER
jgi:uncharacterized protein